MAIGQKIADGQGKYRPRLKCDDFKGKVTVGGYLCQVDIRWPDGAERHEVEVRRADVVKATSA